jgi:hypothetical protein
MTSRLIAPRVGESVNPSWHNELSPISEEEWRKGLRERFEEDDCAVDEEALELIVAAGEGHPRSTMLIAQQTHHSSVEEGTRHIDGTLAERGYRGALAADPIALEK